VTILRSSVITIIVVMSGMLASGCAPRDYRTPLKAITAAPHLRNLQIGVLDVMTVPTVVEAERTALVAFPDDVMFLRRSTPLPLISPERGGTESSLANLTDQRIMVPNHVGLGITDIIVLALRDAGLRADAYRTALRPAKLEPISWSPALSGTGVWSSTMRLLGINISDFGQSWRRQQSSS
jgi:hypothetical protein